MSTRNDATTVRPPAIAGVFYPGDPKALAETIERLLSSAPVTKLPEARLKALIVPHAGYPYSGVTAATAYQQLKAIQARVERVVILGPAHRVAFSGFALPDCSAFRTPLGDAMIDTALAERISVMPTLLQSASAHKEEHSLEVHIPFIQACSPHATILPILVGDVKPEQVSKLLELIFTVDGTFVIISSDLSHFLTYEAAQKKDSDTADHIVALEAVLKGDQACGCRPVNGMLLYCQQQGWQTTLLDLRNSGDTAGDRQRVVGYGAFAVLD